MADGPPRPSQPFEHRADVFLAYLDYFREMVIGQVDALEDGELRVSRLASGWSPLELVHHLTHVEERWLDWGFEGRPVAEPWGDWRDGRWFVGAGATRAELVARLRARGDETRRVVRAHALDERGQPSERWDGEEPPTLERVLLHLLQEYARHAGHLDVVVELAGAHDEGSA